MKVQLDERAICPTRAHDTDAGLDLYTPCPLAIMPGKAAVVNTGVHAELPKNTVGLVASRSGLNINKGLVCTGVIDEGYTGAIVVKLYNLGVNGVEIMPGEKVAQLLVLPVKYPKVEIVDKISGGERGDAGFGSTDEKKSDKATAPDEQIRL